MEELKILLKNYVIKYDKAQVQDIVKLLYQREFGPGHLIDDEKRTLDFLKQEWMGLSNNGSKISYEDIGNGLIRIYLNGVCCEALPILNEIFVRSAKETGGDIENFKNDLNSFLEMCKSGLLPFKAVDAEKYLEKYEDNGYPAVRHSETYREYYHPSYRVVKKSYLQYVKMAQEIAPIMIKKGHAVVAIDGKCASGKSTIASAFSNAYGCDIVHMDDFFLPPELRTKKRMLEPGGNIHYERFMNEVIEPLCKGNEVEYDKFDCHDMEYKDKIRLSGTPLTIIEGSYSMREEFRKAYDYTVFMDCSYDMQLERILERNGEIGLQNFKEKWIPLENRYFDEFGIKDKCDMVIYTE